MGLDGGGGGGGGGQTLSWWLWAIEPHFSAIRQENAT